MADGEVTLSTAFADGTGIIVSAGTGSIAYARDPAGQLHRAGGYGWQLGDEGGGYWLGRRALDVAARAQDGRGEGSTLLARLLGALGLQRFDDLVRWTATATPAQVAALAPHVLNAAGDGEVVAQRAVEDAARELVALVVALERHYPGTAPVSVAMAGGLLGAPPPPAPASPAPPRPHSARGPPARPENDQRQGRRPPGPPRRADRRDDAQDQDDDLGPEIERHAEHLREEEHGHAFVQRRAVHAHRGAERQDKARDLGRDLQLLLGHGDVGGERCVARAGRERGDDAGADPAPEHPWVEPTEQPHEQ